MGDGKKFRDNVSRHERARLPNRAHAVLAQPLSERIMARKQGRNILFLD